MATNIDQQRKYREDANAVENFSKKYYDILDTRRHNVDKFYQTQAKLIWNGNEINGQNAIGNYLVSLPPTKHHIYALDYFPMKDLFPDEDTTYQVFVSGAVIYGTPESTTVTKEKRLFSHIFVLTVDIITSTWVIVNECFRFHE
ncbi:unnamed protein product [Rotaria sp. Silwood1]|nr:unnamed protein product [Rotaria sp. Silwood1]CAF0848930.1 unnamed protein product [Rotaria sp. Silwood1]CAF0959994.1 unnamed protein product [Rotaria sp. Silwood1]CAF3347160.1 unnamed protein product [Rotaria sp. Silwood1]CAF3370844.1 unnamed protein product [Rotaria sp. Silwood1]